MIRTKYGVLLPLLLFVSLFLFLGATDFHTKGEPREAVVALSMWQQDNPILPVNNGVDMAYKPPLLHWCIAASAAVTGAVNEYGARLPSALALAVMVLVGYAFYARRRGREVAMVAALVTLTNFEMHRAGTSCRVDMLLSALMVVALYLLYRWYEKGLRGVPWLAIVCMSGAFLTKGPVGVVLPCLVAALFGWVRGVGWRRVTVAFLSVGAAACILPALWYLAAYRQGGDTFVHLVWEENVGRLLGRMTYGSHEAPAYYNVLTVLAGYMPYTLLVLLSGPVWQRPKLPGGLRQGWARLREGVRTMDGVRLYSLLCVGVIFAFYCIPSSKRSVYLLPIYPFIAYFLAEYILYLIRVRPEVVTLFGRVWGGLALGVLTVFATLRLGWVDESLFTGRHADDVLTALHALASVPLGLTAWLLLGALGVCAGYCLFARPNAAGSRRGMYAVFALFFTLYLALDGLFAPAVLNAKSDKRVAERIATFVPTGRLYSCHLGTTAGNPMRAFTLNFYLGDRVVPFDAFRPAQGYLIAGPEDAAAFTDRHPGYHLTRLYDSGHRSCDDHKVIQLYRFGRDVP